MVPAKPWSGKPAPGRFCVRGRERRSSQMAEELWMDDLMEVRARDNLFGGDESATLSLIFRDHDGETHILCMNRHTFNEMFEYVRTPWMNTKSMNR
jgi:hypothetical protein